MSVTPPDHFSASSWTKWQCPRAWAAHYVYGHDEPATAAMEVGTFAHAVLEKLMRYRPAARTVGSARRLAAQKWREMVTDPTSAPAASNNSMSADVSPARSLDTNSGCSSTARIACSTPMGSPSTETTLQSITRGEITEEAFKRKAWHAITGLWDLEEPTQVDVVATEQRIEWTEGDVPMVAIVDRVVRYGRDTLHPGLSPDDYKTGKVPKPKYQADKKRQITIGALAVAHQEGPLAVASAGSLLYVGAEPAEAIAAPTDRNARAAVSEALQGAWADVLQACADEEFPPVTSALCGWCSCVADCREGQSHIRRAESGGWSWYSPDIPGAKIVAALDAA